MLDIWLVKGVEKVGIERLSALKIKGLKKPGYHCDGGGL